MTAITVQFDDDLADLLRRLATAKKRNETEIVRDALAGYMQAAPPLPAGMGKYHSGQTNGSERARGLIREAIKEEQWP